jgi:5-formyltetrahydrofolate cyclo-ligase
VSYGRRMESTGYGTDAVEEKARLRGLMMDRRGQRALEDDAGAERSRDARAFAEHLGPLVRRRCPAGGTVAAFMPTPTEPPLLDAMEAFHAAGRRVIVPVSLPERRLAWVEWFPDVPVRRAGFGIEEPEGERMGAEEFLRASVRLVPALAVDAEGVRMGYGGGYYDTALDAVGPGGAVGVLYAEELLPAGRVPAQPHDARLLEACTERGLVSFPLGG